jgi:hypothetical protein
VNEVKRKVLAVIAAGLIALAMTAPAYAEQTSYEGQPGNQSSGQHAPGLRGPEGQPGNQGGPQHHP